MHDAPPEVCLHCEQAPQSTQKGRRGLCGRCYLRKDIRSLFPAEKSGPKPRTMCVHCTVKLCNRPRGLCWHCYYTPGVQELYPSTSIYARRSTVPTNANGAEPAEATDALPGTEDKILVMMERAERGESLFHPGDPKQHFARACEMVIPGKLHMEGVSLGIRHAVYGIAEPRLEIETAQRMESSVWVPVVAQPAPKRTRKGTA